MSPVRLDHGVAIHAGRKSGSQANDEGGCILARVGSSLSHSGINQNAGRELPNRPALRIDENGHDAGGRESGCFICALCVHGFDAFDFDGPLLHGARESHSPPHSQGMLKLGDHKREAGPGEADGCAGGQIAAAAHKYKNIGKEHIIRKCRLHCEITGAFWKGARFRPAAGTCAR